VARPFWDRVGKITECRLAVGAAYGHDREVRVVIAGSSGLIGTALVPALRRAGHEVVRLVRRQPSGKDERRWDPPNGRIADGVLDGADAVINLCGAGIGDRRWTEARKQILRDTRTTATEVLAAAVAENGIPVLLNASAVGFYGDTGDAVATEAEPEGYGFLAALCREWEAATEPARKSARVALLRSGAVVSTAGGLLGKLRPLFAFGLGARMGSGRQYLAWISLADEIAAIRYVLEHDTLSGPINLTAPAPVTNAEFTRGLGAALHRPAPWVVPGFVLRIVIGEFADEGLLTGQRAVPWVLENNGFRFLHPALADALAVR
jgi:hypothetical protein